MAMTPAEAKTMLERIEREHPELIAQTCNTVAKESITWAQQSIARDKRIYTELTETKRIVVSVLAALKGEGPTPDANGDINAGPDVVNEHSHAASHGTGPSENHSVPRVNLDGTPMSAEDTAREDAMDQAVAGLPPTLAPSPSPISPETPSQEAEAQVQNTLPTPTPAAPGRPQTRVSRTNKTPAPNAS